MKAMKQWMLCGILILSATAFAQSEVNYDREGNRIKRTTFFAGSELVREVGYLENGHSQGRWVQLNEEGEISIEAYYHEGQKTGTWFVWSDNRQTLYELHYQNNRLVQANRWKIDARASLAGF